MTTASAKSNHPANPDADGHPPVAPAKSLTPGGRVRLARENLCLAMALYAASHRGLISAAFFPPGAEIYLENGAAVDAGVPLEVSDHQSLLRAVGNQVRGAFALSALQTQRELEAAFGQDGPPIQPDSAAGVDTDTDANLRAAHAAIYLIARCVSSDLIAPTWDVPTEYRQSFTIPALDFTLAAAALHGREMRWEQLGGLSRYLDLTLFVSLCLDGADPQTAAQSVAAGDYGALGDLTAQSSQDVPAVSPFDPTPGYGSGSGRLQRGTARHGTDAGDGDGNSDGADAAGWIAPDSPPLPRVAVASQASEMGPVDGFVANACATGGKAMTLAGELYTSYARWCLDNGYLAHSQRKFGLELTARGYQRKRRGKGRHWWMGLQCRESVT